MIVDIRRIRIILQLKHKITWNSDYDPCGGNVSACHASPWVITLLAIKYIFTYYSLN